MSTTFKLKCTCGAIMAVAAKLIGKKAACGGCGYQFTIPNSVPAEKANSPNGEKSFAATAALDATEPLPQLAKALAEKPSKPSVVYACPSCGKNKGQGTILCIHCGYHTKLKRKLEGFDPKELDGQKSEFEAGKRLTEIVLWPAALAFVVGVAFWARGVLGPSFLNFFFAIFCLFGILTLIGRKLWCDTDAFNYVAAFTLGGIGIIRIIDSIIDQRFKFMFLIVGIGASLCLYLLTTTENEKHVKSPFVDEDSKLAALPFLVLFLLVAGTLASIFYIPSVGMVVVKGGYLIALMVFGVLGIIWAAMNFEDAGKGWGGGDGGWGGGSSGCSSCSSCGSSCGGGGCGGGCGGCGG